MNKVVEERPWGRFEQFALNQKCTVKLHYINPGEQWSLQTHKKRSEFFKVLKGNPAITIGDKVVDGKVGEEFEVPLGAEHRVGAKEDGDGAIIFELSFDEFDEKDEVRLEDDYGRT